MVDHWFIVDQSISLVLLIPCVIIHTWLYWSERRRLRYESQMHPDRIDAHRSLEDALKLRPLLLYTSFVLLLYNIDRFGVHNLWPSPLRLIMAWHVTACMLLNISGYLYMVLRTHYNTTADMSGTIVPRLIQWIFIATAIITVVWIHSVTIYTAIKDQEHYLWLDTAWVSIAALIIGLTLTVSLLQLRRAVVHALLSLSQRANTHAEETGLTPGLIKGPLRRSLRDMKCLAITTACLAIIVATYEAWRGYVWYEEDLSQRVWRANPHAYNLERDAPANCILVSIIVAYTIRDWLRRETRPVPAIDHRAMLAHDHDNDDDDSSGGQAILPSSSTSSINSNGGSVVRSASGQVVHPHHSHRHSHGARATTATTQQQYAASIAKPTTMTTFDANRSHAVFSRSSLIIT
jgi:hypothetical protein